MVSPRVLTLTTPRLTTADFNMLSHCSGQRAREIEVFQGAAHWLFIAKRDSEYFMKHW